MFGMYLAAVVGVIQVSLLLAYTTGPPLAVCSNGLKPGSPHGELKQPGNGGFLIATDLPLHSDGGFQYQAGQTYTVTLMGTIQTFKGWIVQARLPSSDQSQDNSLLLLGSFLPNSAGEQQLLDCQDAGGNVATATVCHYNPESTDFWQQVFTWKAPPEENGTVEIYYTVVQTRAVFYTSLPASETAKALDEIQVKTS